MSIGWMDSVAEADAYFATERLQDAYWDALTAESGEKDEKSAVLTQAYNRIRRSLGFSIPTSPTAAQLEALKEAQCETAYYLAQHSKDEDRRKGLHAQGVVQAGVVKESYAESAIFKLPLPPIVYEIMTAAEMGSSDKEFYAVPIARNEDKELTEDPLS